MMLSIQHTQTGSRDGASDASINLKYSWLCNSLKTLAIGNSYAGVSYLSSYTRLTSHVLIIPSGSPGLRTARVRVRSMPLNNKHPNKRVTLECSI